MLILEIPGRKPQALSNLEYQECGYSWICVFDSFEFHFDLTYYILFQSLKLNVKLLVHPETNVTVYDLVSTQLYHDHPQVFDVLENIVIATLIPIFTFVVVVVATTATVVQLKRVIDWRQGASSNVDGTEVWWCCFLWLLLLKKRVVSGGNLFHLLLITLPLLLFLLLSLSLPSVLPHYSLTGTSARHFRSISHTLASFALSWSSL